jgi:HNH endonuclease
MQAALVRQIWHRARRCCEYCRMPQDYDEIGFEIDHIIPRKHGGRTVTGNLALSCFWCNSFKGSDVAGLDSRTRKLTPLFNPRRHIWTRHFRWEGALLRGRTPVGRVTVAVLRINDPFRVALREGLMEEGEEGGYPHLG